MQVNAAIHSLSLSIEKLSNITPICDITPVLGYHCRQILGLSSLWPPATSLSDILHLQSSHQSNNPGPRTAWLEASYNAWIMAGLFRRNPLVWIFVRLVKSYMCSPLDLDLPCNILFLCQSKRITDCIGCGVCFRRKELFLP